MRPAVHIFFGLTLCAFCDAGCASDGVPFELRSGPELAESNRTISIFGFFRDGALTVAAEPSLGPKPWSFLGDACDVAYGPTLVRANPRLARTTDDYARSNGITDELLAVFAPAAEGAMIMSVSMSGQVTIDDAGAEPTAGPPPSSPPRGGGGRGHRGGGGTMPSGSSHRHAVDHEAIELSASFYAVGVERSVAIAETRYVGPSTEAAWKAFSTKLATALPGATCRAGRWRAPPSNARWGRGPLQGASKVALTSA